MRPRIIVIDLQTGMFDGAVEPPIHDAAGVAARVRAVMEWARRTGRPIAFVRHDGPKGDPLAPGAPGWPVWPALGQAEDEPTFAKDVGNAFSNAALAQWVAEQGADEVVLSAADRLLRGGHREGRHGGRVWRDRGFRRPQHMGLWRRERRSDHRPAQRLVRCLRGEPRDHPSAHWDFDSRRFQHRWRQATPACA